jgi:hypothetical protein
MIKFTKKAGVAVAIAAVIGTSAHAATFNATATFRTIADITIEDFSDLSFGQEVTGKVGTTCIVDVTYASASDVTADIGAASTGCTNSGSSMSAGAFTLTGASSGAQITILMETVVGDNFTFAPAGSFNDNNASSSVETEFFPDSNLNVKFDALTAGTLAVGGTLTINTALPSSSSESLDYIVSVVY